MTNSDKLTFEDIIALYNQYTSYGADIPMQHDAYSKLCAAMPQAVGMLKLYKQLLDKAISGLEVIATPLYPEKIFTPLTEEDWQAIKDCCAGRGFALDRLSGEYGRMFTRELNHIAVQTLTDIKQAYDGGEDE